MRLTSVRMPRVSRPSIRPGRTPCPEDVDRGKPAYLGDRPSPVARTQLRLGDRLTSVSARIQRRGIVPGKGTSNCGEVRPPDAMRLFLEFGEGLVTDYTSAWDPLTYPYGPGIYISPDGVSEMVAAREERPADGSLPNMYGADQSTPRFTRTIATWVVPAGKTRARVNGPVYADNALGYTEADAIAIPIVGGPTTYEPTWRLALTTFPEYNDPWQPVPPYDIPPFFVAGQFSPGFDADPYWDPSGADIASGSEVVSVFDPATPDFGTSGRRIGTILTTLDVTPGDLFQLELINETAVGTEVVFASPDFTTAQFAWPTDGASPPIFGQAITIVTDSLVTFL